jgi:hypothetical protein
MRDLDEAPVRDIHGIDPREWGHLGPDRVGEVMEVRIRCVHPFGIGVELVDEAAYGHVNVPSATDGVFTEDAFAGSVGEVRPARLISAEPGRQATFTLRPSEL